MATATETTATSVPTHRVGKPFEGPNGKRLESGTLVSARDWRNLEALVSCRYLHKLDPGEV